MRYNKDKTCKFNYFNIFLLIFSKGFTKDLNGKKIDITLKMQTSSLVGDYKLDGQVLILPIQGLGKCNLTLGIKAH